MVVRDLKVIPSLLCLARYIGQIAQCLGAGVDLRLLFRAVPTMVIVKRASWRGIMALLAVVIIARLMTLSSAIINHMPVHVSLV